MAVLPASVQIVSPGSDVGRGLKRLPLRCFGAWWPVSPGSDVGRGLKQEPEARIAYEISVARQ